MDRKISRREAIRRVGLTATGFSLAFPAFIPQRSEAADVLKIGQLEDLTGTFSAVSRNEVRGAGIAIDRWNARGGVLGRKVEGIVEDGQSSPGVSVEKATVPEIVRPLDDYFGGKGGASV